MTIKIKIDKEKCIGCGACTIVAPDIFELDENGKSRVKTNAFLNKELIKQATESCPVQAIEISD